MPWEFGRLTPGEFSQLVDGYRARREANARDRVELAWLAAQLARQKKIPPLQRLLPRGAEDEGRKSLEERRAEFEALRASLGSGS